jgi:hypothetical protein
MMATFTADQIIGKELFPLVQTSFYTNPNNTKSAGTIKAGQSAGVVYSWVKDANGNLYWQFYNQNKKPFYIRHRTGLFDINALKNQQAKTVEELNKEQAEKTLFETNKVEYYLRKYGLYVLGTFILAAIIKKKL